MKWIPVNEKLPETEDTVFICVVDKYDDELEYKTNIDLGSYDHEKEGWRTENDWDEGQEFIEVMFWKPIKYPKEPNKHTVLEQIKLNKIKGDF